MLNDCAPLGRLGTGSGPEDRLTRTSRAMVPSWLWRQSSPKPLAAAGCLEPPRGTPYDLHSGPVRKHRTLEQTVQTHILQVHLITPLTLLRKEINADLASISSVMVVRSGRVNRWGCGGVGKDVDEVWINHFIVKEVKDDHSIRSICEQRTEFMCLWLHLIFVFLSSVLRKYTRVYGVEVDVDGLRSVGVDLHHGWRGKHQDVRAGRVLRRAQLRRLHVERGAATKHWTRRHRICQEGGRPAVSSSTLEPKRGAVLRFSFPLPGMMTKEPCGSIATRQALRILGVSAAEMPHILQVSFKRLLRDCRFLLLSRILQSGTTA